MSAPRDERIDIAMVIWLIRAGDRVVLFDTGFHRERWMEAFDIADFIPDSAVRLAGVEPGDVTDVIISHAHWDHMGGIDRLPNALLHIQQEEYTYYTGAAWQEGGRNGGIDEADILELVRRTRRAASTWWTATTWRSCRGSASSRVRATPAHRSTFAWTARRRSCSRPTTATSITISSIGCPARRSCRRTALRMSVRSSA
jgi:ribonuclease BN (tRNA processing enzyme)